MASKEVISGMIHLVWEPEGPVSYELYSGSSAVVFDQNNEPSVSTVSVVPFRLSGISRTRMAVNGTNDEFAVVFRRWLSDGTEMPRMKTTTIGASNLRNCRTSRFDFLPVDAIKGDLDITYSEDSILTSREICVLRDGQDGNGSFTSRVFMRCPSTPSRPTGGTYSNPIPTSVFTYNGKTYRWSDTATAGTDPVWMSTARFESTHTGTKSPTWTDPVPVVDSMDIEFIWSAKESPKQPLSHPFSASSDVDWSKDASDAVWMASAIKTNGVWGEWTVVRVKGEKGDKGDKGDPGEDCYTLDLDNEMQGIPCTSTGVVTTVGTLAVTNATVYKGSSVDSGWGFSKRDSGCTSVILGNKVSVTAISADKATVTVVATKNGMTREAVMSLYKVKAGSNGASPVVYSIEVSDNSIKRDKNGNLSPTSITVYQQKTVGNTTSRTTECTLKYQRVGQDSAEITVPSNGVINGITSTCTAIRVRLYYNNVMVDSETIPIVADGEKGDKGDKGDGGNDGKDAVMYSLILSPSSLTYDLNSKSYDTSSVHATILKTVGDTRTEVTANAEGLNLSFDLYVDGAFHSNKACQDGNVTFSTAQYSRVDFILKKGGKTIASETLAITTKGENGTNGKNGVWVPPAMLFTDYPVGYAFQSGDLTKTPIDTRLDIALEEVNITVDGQTIRELVPYRCKSGYTKVASSPLPSKDTTHWEKCDSGVWKFVATELLWAANARIEFMSGQSIRVGEGADVCGYFGAPTGGAIFFSGGSDVSKATFVVYKDGRVVAKYADIEGAIMASTIDLKISTSDGSKVPDGSLCYDTSAVKLPELAEGRVRVLRIVNPYITRSTPEALYLIPATSNVGVYASLRFDHQPSGNLVLSECGRNGAVYIELLGYYNPTSKFTQWGVVRNDKIE